MSNEVKIVVSGEDKSNAALASATKNVDGMGASLKRMGETAGGINLAEQFGQMSESAKAFLSNTKNAASGLEQSMGAVDSVFKGSADQIHEWGSAAAENVGLSERAFNESASSIGSLLKNLGFNMDETTSKTGELTKRAADMAAMFGGDTSEAIEAISSALRGESDPIERYGVMLNEATVNAKAMAMTGKDTADSLSMQEKAAARLALIMEQTSDAQGTFARESDTVAGSQQRMNAAIEDAQASLGSMFAPVVKFAADAVENLVGMFENLPGPAKFVVGSIVVLLAAASAIAPTVTAAATALGALGVSATAAGTALRTASAFIAGPWGVAIGASVGLLAMFGSAQEDAKSKTTEFTIELDKQTGAVSKASVEGLLKWASSADTLTTNGSRVKDVLKDFGLTAKDLVGYMLGNADATERVNRALSSHDSAAERNSFQQFLDESKGKIEDQTKAEHENADAAHDLADAQDAAAAAQERHKDEIDAATEALEAQTEALLASRDAQRGLRDAIADADKVMKDSKATDDDKQEALDNIAAKTLEAIKATRDAADANHDGMLSQQELIDSGSAMMETLDKGREAFIATARQMGMNEDQAKALADQLGLIPGSVYTTVELLGAVVAQQNLEQLKRAIDNIPRTITVSTYVRGANVTPGSGGHQYVGQASGGITGIRAAAAGGAQNGPTLINEADGAGELVELPSGSRVMTAGATRAYLEQGLLGGGGPVNVIVSMTGDDVTRAILKSLRIEIANSYGGSVQAALGARGVS